MGFLGGEKLILGYDLGNEYCQISYAVSETGEVETLSQVAGTQNYNIPAVLCKRSGVNQWFYGKEALRYAEEQKGILVQDLLAQALDGEPVIIEGESFNSVALLTLFVKRSLGLLNQVGSSEKIGAMMITCRVLDNRMLEVLSQIVAGLHLKTDRVSFQSHTESFYHYMVHQPQELWTHQALLLDYGENCIRAYRMECNRRTTPVVVFIDERAYPFAPKEPLPEVQSLRERRMEELDAALLRIAEESCKDAMIESVFLIGDGFEQEWMKNSLRYLCRGRRVFQGNNLFGKGACHGMQEKLSPNDAGREYVFLGNEKLKANIGMKILRQGKESYYALLDAGVNWYEAGHTFEFYLQGGNQLSLTITPLIGKQIRTEQLVLEDFPGAVARLKGHFYLESEKLLIAEVEDLGFGEIRPASGRTWKKKIELY